MYTFENAIILLRYYQDKLIGKPLNLEKARNLPVSYIKIKGEGKAYRVLCYAKASSSVEFFSDIRMVIKGTDLLQPDEVLAESINN
jgi:hypothetical protein